MWKRNLRRLKKCVKGNTWKSQYLHENSDLPDFRAWSLHSKHSRCWGHSMEMEGCLWELPMGLFLCTFLGCMGNQRTSLEYSVKFHLLNKTFLVNIQVPLLERKINACPKLTQVELPFWTTLLLLPHIVAVTVWTKCGASVHIQFCWTELWSAYLKSDQLVSWLEWGHIVSVLSFPQLRFAWGEEQTHVLDNLFWNKGNGADVKCLMERLFSQWVAWSLVMGGGIFSCPSLALPCNFSTAGAPCLHIGYFLQRLQKVSQGSENIL